ncbi:uncharacterized protein LOC143251742 [Tachypleus tridentatus]|uniref:uncharacterized protein LOC143251742 n=1 Tax=Tachypleus tridentatus TaxID=6853 RepID=UPI003FD42675
MFTPPKSCIPEVICNVRRLQKISEGTSWLVGGCLRRVFRKEYVSECLVRRLLLNNQPSRLRLRNLTLRRTKLKITRLHRKREKKERARKQNEDLRSEVEQLSSNSFPGNLTSYLHSFRYFLNSIVFYVI